MSIDWDIIRKSTTMELTEEENAALQEWLAGSERHRSLYRKVSESGGYAPTGEQMARWRSGFEKQLNAAAKRRRKTFRLRAASIAAAAVIVLAMVPLWFAQRHGGYKVADRKILLTTSTGEVLDWDEVVANGGFGFDGVAVSKEKSALTITDMHAEPEVQPVMTTLFIPGGKDFFLELGDGTKVWLNSDTELKFPLAFARGEREVFLKGEAYFEVAHDGQRPFFVRTADAAVEVLGTSFNVSAYEDDRRTEAALLEGKVNFNAPGGQYMLEPGEVASLDGDGNVTVAAGDVYSIASWRTGVYDYRDMPLEELVTKLGRWYGVWFEFSDESARTLRFSGAISRSRDLEYMLGMISKTTSVEFTAKKDAILVSLKH